MNLHQIATPEPPAPPPIPEVRYYGNEQLLWNFMEEHGEQSLHCSCGHYEWERDRSEEWRRTEKVNFHGNRIIRPQVAASTGAADYYDDNDDGRWACAACDRSPWDQLRNLLDRLEKEYY